MRGVRCHWYIAAMHLQLLFLALASGLVGTFFTHQIFVKFVLAAMRANKVIQDGGEYQLSDREMLVHTLQIVLGLIPLGFGIVGFIRWSWMVV